MDRLKITWDNLHADCKNIIDQIRRDASSNIEVVVGLMRGGTVPATIISHALDIPMYVVGIKSYITTEKTGVIQLYQDCLDEMRRMNHTNHHVLVVDDISDTGETLDYIVEAYAPYCKSVRTATPYIKIGTRHIPHYYAFTYPRQEWLDFPWEVNTSK